MNLTMSTTVTATPYDFTFVPSRAALIVIDMQRDFLEPGGFGAALGNDVAHLRRAIEPNRQLLAAWRAAGLPVIHTREGHLADLSDLPPSKHARPPGEVLRIGDSGPMGRILVRGELGHGIIPELAPLPGELVIDKPGKGAFYATELQACLQSLGASQLVITGVTTEICVHSTVREANDRGYDCVVPADCTASYFPQFHAAALEMIAAQGGILGWVSHSQPLLSALAAL
jgi:nicotinamidase-related amidase